MNYIINPFKRIFDYNGKASIKEFWYFFLFFLASSFFIGVLASILSSELLKTVFRIIMLIPFISLGFRRLNDAGFNRWLFLIPIVNLILAGIKKSN